MMFQVYCVFRKPVAVRTGFLLLLALALAAMGGCKTNPPAVEPSSTPLPATATQTVAPTATSTPEPTATATATPTSTMTSTPEPTATATPPPTATPTPQPVLLVHIVDADSGAPVAGAGVQLADKSQTTDEQGQVQFDGLDQGSYTLTVLADGYQESSSEVDVVAGENQVKVNLIARVFADITIDAGNLRAGPGTIYAVRGSVKADDRFEVIGKSADGEWLVVAIDQDTSAWLWSGACVIKGALYRVEVIDAPPTPTPAPPTATPTPAPTPTPDVVVYPQSSIEPWNLGAFQRRLKELHKSFFDAKWWLSGVLQSRHFYCSSYANWYDSWVTSAVFQDVPSDWVPLYREYRSMVEGAVNLTHPMYNVCMTGSGRVLVTEVKEAHTHIDAAEIRLLDMMVEAGAP